MPMAPAQDHSSKRKGKTPTAVETIAQREIVNAIDAGEGDVLTRALRQKVVEEPANIEARLALAAAYEKQGAPELAIDHYRIAATQYGSETAASLLSRTLEGLGESEDAVAVLVQFCDSHEQASSRILSELGILEDEMGKLTNGEHYHERALTAALTEGAAHQDALHSNLGYNLIRQKRFGEAQVQLRTAIALNRNSVVARNNLAYALAGEPSATSVQINEAILQWQSLSGPAAAHNNLAAVYMEQGRYPEAREELRMALAYDRGSAAAFKNLEELASLDGKPASVPVSAAPAEKSARAKPSVWKRWFGRHHGKNDPQPGEVAAVKADKK
jgi:tetratricopeptide (TPR) repeat protein